VNAAVFLREVEGQALNHSAAFVTIARSFEENRAFHREPNQRAAANGRDPGEPTPA
jgi:hypothetical protein